MKTIKYLLLFSSILFFKSCKEAEAIPYYGIDFLFKEAQPINDREINHLPNKFIGSYINQDSTYLIIEDKIIYYKWITKNNMSYPDFNSLKDSLNIIDNKIYHEKDIVEFRSLKDSIELTSFSYDTIFSLSEINKAKRIKGMIVLNIKDANYWSLKVLSLDKKVLSITYLVSDEDKIRLDSLSKIKVETIDSTKYVFELSNQEFKKMLDLKKFGYKQEYKKIK